VLYRMNESIVQDLRVERCYVCGYARDLEYHHIMHGTANRRLSTRYGLTCWLCSTHHRGRFGVHNNAELNHKLQEVAQTAFEKTHSHTEWMKIFGKNYL
jgi:hypothetical protein